MNKVGTALYRWTKGLLQTCASMGYPLITLIILALVGWFALEVIEREVKNALSNELTLTLSTNVATTKNWIESRKSDVIGWANYKDSHQEILDLIALASRDKSELRHSKELAKLRERLELVCKNHRFIGFVVFDKSGEQIGALYDKAIGQNDLKTLSDFFHRSLQGETVVSLPFLANIPLPAAGGELKLDQPTLFASTPIHDKGEIVGVFSFRLNPGEFARILESARSGETGETYAFDRKGLMISDSRFNVQLKNKGLIPGHPDSRAILTLRLNLPGENKLTRMAASATRGVSGIDVDGYPDYRGIPVIGAWTWLREYGFGIATEIDSSEAFIVLSNLRALFLVLYAFLVISTVISLVLRKREMQAVEMLQNANKYLEIGIQERTVELSAANEHLHKLSRAAEQSPSSIIITDKAGKIEYVNPKFTRLSGFTPEEIIGKNPRILKSGKTTAGEYDDLWRTIISGGEWRGEFQNRKKNGDHYWGMAAIAPISDPQGRTTHFISSMEDITERKLAEEQLKASLLEKEVLMREINHRAKNNMQVISSLIKMQSRDSRDPSFTKLAQDLDNRIAAMNLVHDQILQSKDLTRIDTGRYIASLVRNILASYGENGGRIALNADIGDISLDVETCVHCGLIINELVSNSMKYAFLAEQRGVIGITLHHGLENGNIELIVRDNGMGLKEDIDIRKIKSLGLRLVTTLAENQLHGKVELNRNHGTEFKVIFPAVK